MKRKSWFPGFVPVAMCLALAGLVQPAVHAVDTTPPVGAVIINNYRSVTDTTNVTLTLTWDDLGGSGVSRMRFSDDGAHWSVWEPVVATRAYALPSGPDGYRTVRVQYLDKANNRSAVYSDHIHLITSPDTAPPTGTVVINSNIASTAGTSIVLELTWDDGANGLGVSKMRFSDDGSHWTAWQRPPYAVGPQITLPYTLTGPFGYKTIRVQHLDRAGNRSAVCSDYIKYAQAAERTILLPGGVPLVMVWIPGGTFMMGRRYEGEGGSYPSEDPRHSVTLGGYWMAKYELTKRQWLAVMGTTPWSGQEYVLDDLDSPAVFVSWDDAQAFLAAANSLAGKALSLPSEAQWEYACRAGTQTSTYWGNDVTVYGGMGKYAWYIGNTYSISPREEYAHVVGLKLPNAFGLYDMMGNVFEWCEDDYHPNYTGAPAGGEAWVDTPRSSGRVMRGGNWRDPDIQWWRSARRFGSTPGSTTAYAACVRGFRVALTP